MRRLLLAGLLAAGAALPVSPAHAGPAACVVVSGFPACAGTCRAGDPITVVAMGQGGGIGGEARCGGGDAGCTVFRLACRGDGTATGSGTLQCDGDADVIICLVGTSARTSP
jgi:hypothetical protein